MYKLKGGDFMKIMKKILCTVLVVVMCLTSAPLGGFVGLELPEWNLKASALASSGQCGDNVYWNYDSDTGELVISGTGEMTNYSSYTSPFNGASIRSIVFENGVTSIGDGSFRYCQYLMSVDMPDSILHIGKEAFINCCELTNVKFSSNLKIIDDKAFLTSGLTMVNIPDSVTTIGDQAFWGCDSLSSVNIGKGVTSIGSESFGICMALTNITVDNANKAYSSDGKGVLFNKDKTILIQYPCGNSNEFYVIPNSVKTIGEYAFLESNNLEYVSLGDKVTKIGVEAFAGCYNLKSITLEDSLKIIDDGAFLGCRNLLNIVIPNSVTSIGNYAFNFCERIENATIGDSVTTIGKSAFQYCKSLISVTIPDSVNIIGEDAFQYCNSLKEMFIGDGVTTISNHFFVGCTNLEKVVMGNGVKVVGDSAFANCKSLVSVTFGDSVTTIGNYVFFNCSNLTNITFSDKVKYIGNWIFDECYNVTDIYFKGTEKQWNEIVFEDGNAMFGNATIHFLGEEECEHNPIEQTIPATCTVNGMKFYICLECGETIGEPTIIPAGHTPGEWVVTAEPTYEKEGKRVKYCTVCGEVVAEETLAKLEKQIVEDKETGVAIEIPTEGYDGKVEIEVEESFDGTAFNILDAKTGAVQQKIYDIKMLVDGEAVQPNGKITVKLPLPAGYNPKFSYVYYVNTETGAVEKMKATYEDGYMVFETDHFSYYAIIAEPDTDNCSCNCHAGGIKKFFFKIGLFFQKIFKKNKTCKCGVGHY